MPATGRTTHKVNIQPTQQDYARYVNYVTRRVTGNARWHYLVSIAVSVALARVYGDWMVAHKWMFDTPEMYIAIYLVLNILILRSSFKNDGEANEFVKAAREDYESVKKA